MYDLIFLKLINTFIVCFLIRLLLDKHLKKKEQRPWGMSIPRGGDCSFKGPGVGQWLECLRNSQHGWSGMAKQEEVTDVAEEAAQAKITQRLVVME
jgi:hypothetical protein